MSVVTYYHFHVVLSNTYTKQLEVVCNLTERGQTDKEVPQHPIVKLVVPRHTTLLYLHELQVLFRERKLPFEFYLFVSDVNTRLHLFYSGLNLDLVSAAQIDHEAHLILMEEFSPYIIRSWFSSLRNGVACRPPFNGMDQTLLAEAGGCPPELGEHSFVNVIIMEVLCNPHAWERLNHRYIITTNIALLQRNICAICFLIDLNNFPHESMSITLYYMDQQGRWCHARTIEEPGKIQEFVVYLSAPFPTLFNLARTVVTQTARNFHSVKQDYIRAQLQHWHTVMNRFPQLQPTLQQVF